MPIGIYKRTEYHRRINSESQIGKHIITETQRQKMIGRLAWNKGKKFSIESRLKMSQSMKGRIPWNKGKHFSEAIKAKMRKSAKEKHCGEQNGMWCGGISFEGYKFVTRSLKKLIRDRDGHKCRMCGVPEAECLKKLDIHHIDYDKQNDKPSNLISLCHRCHSSTNNTKKREYFKKVFSN